MLLSAASEVKFADPFSRTSTVPLTGTTLTLTPVTGGGTGRAAAATPQSSVVETSIPVRTMLVPSAFIRKSSSWRGPFTSAMNAIFEPSGDQEISHTSPRLVPSVVAPPPPEATTLTDEMLYV